MKEDFDEEENFDGEQEDDSDETSENSFANSNKNKFIILELNGASNVLGRELMVAKVNPIDTIGTGSFGMTMFTPYICDKTQTFVFDGAFKEYLIYHAQKQKPITVDTNNCDYIRLDGKTVSLINELSDYESYEEFYNLPEECQVCQLDSPRCQKCEYMSCCLECEYCNVCNR
ncbi:MAG: hypothetical protein LBC68_07815 [Prevotellaceae bacterium]|jgi:hypothetical protein|nr:hypothetical protein [Prevotellaceae bacterium]